MIRAFIRYVLIVVGAFGAFCHGAAVGGGMSRLSQHVPYAALARSQLLSRKVSTSRMKLAITLAPTNSAGLEALLARIYNPKDSLYHQFLTPSQFLESFAPTDQDIQQVSNYLTARGLNIAAIHSNHLVIDVEGATSDVENAFQLQMNEYLTSDQRIAYAPSADPLISDEISGKITAVVGLSNLSQRKPHLAHGLTQPLATSNASITDFLTPSSIKNVYGLNNLTQTGAGQNLGLVEFDGYTASDVSGYTSYFGINEPSLQNVLVDNATATPSTPSGDGPLEVTLDIELMMALAPGASNIYVYIGPNSDQGTLDLLSRIASDNVAKSVSDSWGIGEPDVAKSTLNAEYTIFQQMAAQGQSMFAAAGDSGAYGDTNQPAALAVEDPASQPYVVGVGGTTLNWNGSGTYLSETAWGTAASGGNAADGGGGGLSSVWAQPSWQSGLNTSANLGSAQMRMVPDVSLEANPNEGYAVHFNNSWQAVGGTSCASPLWAAFTALVNQQRIAFGLGVLGFPNPAIYRVAESSVYPTLFHDIPSGSNNLYYPTETGFDLATGWGSFNGSALFSELSASLLPPLAPTNFTIQVVQ